MAFDEYDMGSVLYDLKEILPPSLTEVMNFDIICWQHSRHKDFVFVYSVWLASSESHHRFNSLKELYDWIRTLEILFRKFSL